MCCNSTVQLGALTSESFSERMISAATLLVDTYRLHLNDEMIDELIALRMSKKFVDRILSENSISTMQFEKIKSNKRAKLQCVVIAFVLVTSIVACHWSFFVCQ